MRAWTINLVLGYAHIREGGMKRIDIVDGATRSESIYAHFGEILLQILQQHAGWNREEALTALRRYGYDYFQRHEAVTPSEQQKK